MGWSFAMQDTGRKAHIESLTAAKHFSNGYVPITYRVVGNHVWQLVQKPDGAKFITLDLIAKERNGGWGYKGMDEDSGPFYFDCPTTLLDKADPPATANAEAWRTKVWEYADRQKKLKLALKTLRPGDTVTHNKVTYTLSSRLSGQLGWMVRDSGGHVWRMSPKTLADAVKRTLT